MRGNLLLFIVLTVVASGCGGGVTSADIQFQEINKPDQFQEELQEIYEFKEAEVSGDVGDYGEAADGIEIELDDLEVPETTGFTINRPQFAGGFTGMKSSSYSLTIGMAAHPLGKKAELESANFRLKVGFIAAIKEKLFK